MAKAYVIAGRIHAFLRAGCAAGEHQRVGPFLARFTSGSDHPMLNYAVPDDGALATTEEIGDLEEVFRRRGLRPRLEYAAGAAPGLESVLLAAGFERERLLPVMTCLPREVAPGRMAAGFIVSVVERDRDHLAAIAVADEAYGEPNGRPGTQAVAARRKLTAQGGAVVLARESDSGDPAGSGLFQVPRWGVSELAAIATRSVFRNRGVASSVVSRLVERAARRNVSLLWLTPEDATAERIYARSGFAVTGETMVHISLPAAP